MSLTKQICNELLFRNLKKNGHVRENVSEIKKKGLDECRAIIYTG